MKFIKFLRMAILFCFFLGRFCFFGVPGSMLSCFCFSAVLLLCFFASLLFRLLLLLLLCFSAFLLFAFPASLLFMLLCFTCFFSFLLLCFLCFSAFVLLCLSTSTITILLFLSSVMRFCCSTSCSFASLLPVFNASLFFSHKHLQGPKVPATWKLEEPLLGVCCDTQVQSRDSSCL